MFSINFNKIKNGLEKSRNSLLSKVRSLFNYNDNADLDIQSLEEILISSDIGASLSEKLVSLSKQKTYHSYDDLISNLKENLKSLLLKSQKGIKNDENVLVFVGVNGAGKTTTLGKLANLYNKSGEKVLIVPADTFRAAANEQLSEWANRSGVDIFTSNSQDPSAVIFECMKFATSKGFTKVLIDTAGRLQTKTNLMSELKKIKNVLTKFINMNQVKVLLVLDSTAGQNGIVQATDFNNVVQIDGIILTKLDGTAKGGIVFQIVDKFNIPIYHIGIGEAIDDLIPFDIDEFVESFFSTE